MVAKSSFISWLDFFSFCLSANQIRVLSEILQIENRQKIAVEEEREREKYYRLFSPFQDMNAGIWITYVLASVNRRFPIKIFQSRFSDFA